MTTTTRRLQTTTGAISPWRSLRTKVTLFTLAIFVIGIWSLSFFASYTLHNDMEKTLSDQQFSTVSILAADINDQLDERSKSLGKVAELITPAMLSNAAAIQKFLESQPALTQMFNGGLWVARLDGVAIADVPVEAERIGVNYSDRDWLVEVFKGKAIIGTPVMGKKLKAPIIPIAAPVRDADGKVIGVLTGATDLGKPNFLSAISDHAYGSTGGYFLVSPKIRTIVFATDKKRIMEVLPAPGVNPFIDRTLQGWEGSGIVVGPLGVEVLRSAKHIPVAGWYMVALVPTEYAFAPIHLLRQRILLATIFLTLLAGCLTWWRAKRQLDPALTTIKTLATLADTDQPPQPLPITRQDEIGELIGGFNRLLLTLEQRGELVRKSEERNRTILQTAMDGFWLVDMQGRLLEVNNAACRLNGYSEQEMRGMRVRDLMADGTDDRVAARIKNILTGGEAFFESRLRHKDGSVFDVEVGVQYLPVDGGMVVSFLRDITARKQKEARNLLEQAVEEREKQLRKESDARKRPQEPLQEENDTILLVDDEASVLSALTRALRNSPYQLLTAGSADEALEMMESTNIKVIVSDEQMVGMRGSELLAEVEKRFPHTLRMLLTGHATLEASMRAVNEGQVYRFLTKPWDEAMLRLSLSAATEKYNSDAEKRRLAEELRKSHDHLEQRVEERTKQLRESEERLQLALQVADVGIFEFDVASNRFTWDTTMCRFYGISSDKQNGSYAAWEAAIHPEDLPKMQEMAQQALLAGSDFSAETRIVWPDGSIHWIKGNALIQRDSEGRALRATGTNLDITADKLLVETAEAASRAKSLFIGNMSHELRTPLSGVLGMTEALLNTTVTEQQRDYAEKIRKSGRALLAVVGNILDFSKISAGNMALESSPFFVESVVENVVNLFGPSAAEEKIGLHTIIHPELPAVRGDVHRLTQVISNLVGNAVKFTKKGEIQVAVKIMRQTEIEVELAIGVQDTGIGMTEEELSRIFTGFTQGDTSRGRRFGGTGLGLTISRNLVELMGGTLQVESVFGKGSLFTVLVTFPIAQGFVRMKSELKSPPANAPSAPITPVAPPRPERPPGDMAELQTLLEQLKTPLDRGEPRPCKEIMATLLEKSWPEEQETLIAELDRLVKRYRLQEALDLLNKDVAEK